MSPNQSEAEAWNSTRGHDWVRNQVVMDALLAPVLDLTLEAARLAPGEAVLDIGCGAGATTLAAARAVGPAGRALGLDISAPLLDHARDRAKGLANVTFQQADAQTHPFAPTFDVLISRFGVMFFDDPAAAFANMARALRPGGRLSVAAWAGPALNPWFTLPVSTAAPWLGPPPPLGDGPGPMAFADIARVTGLLRAAGFVQVTGTPIDTWVTPLGSVDEVVALALSSGPASRLIAARNPSDADLNQIRQACRTAFLPHVTASGIRVPACVNLFQARLTSG